jgi:hypothetical protein
MIIKLIATTTTKTTGVHREINQENVGRLCQSIPIALFDKFDKLETSRAEMTEIVIFWR